MPIYTHECGECGSHYPVFARVADRDNVAPECCGVKTARVLDAPMVQVPGGLDVRYRCPMTDVPVTSMRQRKYLMEKNGVVDARDFTDHWARADAKKKAEKAEAQAAMDAIPEAVKKAALESAPLGA